MSLSSTQLNLPPQIDRKPLFDSTAGLVENVLCSGHSLDDGAEKFSPEFQVAFPYRGLFIWHVGHDDVVVDANQVLFVTGGEPYRLSDPVSGPVTNSSLRSCVRHSMPMLTPAIPAYKRDDSRRAKEFDAGTHR